MMEGTTKEKQLTVQGLGTPVPASCEGGHAGPGTSSTSDRKATEVGNLASAALPVTRHEEKQPVVEQETGEAAEKQDFDVGKLQKQLNQLKIEEAESFTEIGKRIQRIEGVLKGYQNVHKKIRDANEELVILWSRMKNQREEKEELERAYEEALRRAKRTAEKPVNVDQGAEAYRRKVVAGQRSSKASSRGDTEIERKKREATSPLQTQTPGKKRKATINSRADAQKNDTPRSSKEADYDAGRDPPVWEKVENRRRNKQDKRSTGKTTVKGPRARRPEAVAVKVTEEISYAEILRQIKSKVNPESCGAEISGIRRTRGGDLLVELSKGNQAAESLRQAVATALGDVTTVRTMGQGCTLEIRDLDEVTEKQDVVNSIMTAVEGTEEEAIKVHVLKTRFGGTQMAIVTVPVKTAEKLMEAGRVKIGWVLGRVRQRAQIVRCFKCLGFGHVARDCKGLDRSKNCRLCGKGDHLAKECKEEAFCAICNEDQADTNHILGSAKCPAFQKALKKAKR